MLKRDLLDISITITDDNIELTGSTIGLVLLMSIAMEECDALRELILVASKVASGINPFDIENSGMDRLAEILQR
jgi:hypothetical protein